MRQFAHWRLMLAIVVLVVLTAVAGRGLLREWTEARLQSQHARQLAALPEADAARLVLRLAEADGELALVARSLADERPGVADAAEHGLTSLLARWEPLPAEEAAPRVTALADHLARVAPDLPIERRRAAHALAERLLWWPLDSREIEGTKLIADCEGVLRLPLPVPKPLAATAEATPPADEPAAELPATEVTAEGAPPESAPAATALSISDGPTSDGPSAPLQTAGPPSPLPDAGSETAIEPRQFLPPRAARIPEDESQESGNVRER